MEFFLVRIFSYSDLIWRFTPSHSILSLNLAKYGPEKNPYLDTFYTVYGEKRAVADTAAAVEVAVTLTDFR